MLGWLACCAFVCSIAAASPRKRLTKTQADQAVERIVGEWKDSERKRLDYVTTEQKLRVDTLVMPLHWQIFGAKPADGRSLYISLHGGGNAPAALNDSQWSNQTMLYQPKEGVYVCPRAPYNDWDMHFKPLLDRCYRALITYCVTHWDVNPDRVYIMGYSAGGDGVWRLAPRMADTWAAASMMAGHPGDVRLENLRNTPFSIWCGEWDAAYDRNRLAAERMAEMDSLQAADSEGYAHWGFLAKGKGHWMDRVDTVAVSWMARYTRNPYPSRVVWHQEAHQAPFFYWLKVRPQEVARHKEVRASYAGNTITVEASDYRHLTLCLNDRMMDLDRPVRVIFQGREVCNKRVRRSESVIRRNLLERQDERFAFTAELEVKLW